MKILRIQIQESCCEDCQQSIGLFLSFCFESSLNQQSFITPAAKLLHFAGLFPFILSFCYLFNQNSGNDHKLQR